MSLVTTRGGASEPRIGGGCAFGLRLRNTSGRHRDVRCVSVPNPCVSVSDARRPVTQAPLSGARGRIVPVAGPILNDRCVRSHNRRPSLQTTFGSRPTAGRLRSIRVLGADTLCTTVRWTVPAPPRASAAFERMALRDGPASGSGRWEGEKRTPNQTRRARQA
jgi:hypothetical protein